MVITYLSSRPDGVSTLDIRTRLRIAEAELAIVQREVSDLLVERNTLESSARQYEESWRFAVNACGRYCVMGGRDGFICIWDHCARNLRHSFTPFPHASPRSSGVGVSCRGDPVLDNWHILLHTV